MSILRFLLRRFRCQMIFIFQKKKKKATKHTKNRYSKTLEKCVTFTHMFARNPGRIVSPHPRYDVIRKIYGVTFCRKGIRKCNLKGIHDTNLPNYVK